MITLTAEGTSELVTALAQAFTPDDLDHKVAGPLGIPLAEISGARSMMERAASLVDWAIHAGRLDDLLTVALRGNPTNASLRRINEANGLLLASGDIVEVMRAAIPAGGEPSWLRSLAQTQRQVCRVHVTDVDSQQAETATGFLVGPDQIMTLASPALGDLLTRGTAPRIEIEFEDLSYLVDRVGGSILVALPHGIYVLHVERQLAREFVQSAANVAVRSRGWIAPERVPQLEDGPIAVVQYADRGVLVTAGQGRFIGSDPDTFTYRATTHQGSAGAPCFDRRWRLVGIHVGHHHDDTIRDDQSFGRSVVAIARDLNELGFGWDDSRGVSPVERTTMAQPPASSSSSDLLDGVSDSLHIDDDGWSEEVQQLDLPMDECWAWAEAAAVHASYDPAVLAPFGDAATESRIALLLESRDVGGRWVMSEQLRRRSLQRLAARGELPRAHAANPTDRSDLLDSILADLINGRAARIVDTKSPDALRTLLTAIDWLDGVVSPLPDRDHIRASLERATLLAPFRHLTRGFFAGRERELERLKAYAGGAGDTPLFIHGPGGMGKSALLAHFVLENSDFDPMKPTSWRPFVYLDFDRPELDATDLVGVLIALVNQLGPQVPALAGEAQAFAARQAQRKMRIPRSERRLIRKRPNLAQQITPDRRNEVTGELIALLQRLDSTTPIVLILDTLEEVQFANPDAVAPLVELVRDLRRGAPWLRPILAGRIPADHGVEPMELEKLSLIAAEALLGNELPPALASRTELVARIAEVVGGNPLSLRLAAELVRREADDAETAIEELSEGLKQRVNDAIVQGRLYERILLHIHHDGVRAVAYPGLVLRRITPVLIREVLAVPCGLGLIDEDAARDLFDALAKEVAVVREGRNEDELELRTELRRIVCMDFANDTKSAAQRTQIHRAAVAFYKDRTTVADRAEEIYHRLALGEHPDDVDKRWLTGVEAFLREAVVELPSEGATYLANRVGGVVDEEQIATAAPIEWEEWAAKRAGDLLKFAQPAKALELMAMRSDRLPTSRLHYIESIARRSLPTSDLPGAARAAERAVAAARASANSDDLRDALDELVVVRRLCNDNAGLLRALAELGNLGDMLGDDIGVLQSNLLRLEAMPAFGREGFTRDAIRVFNRLPDELVARAPELSRRVAAQVGADDTATLQRVIRLVGTGSLDHRAAEELRNVLGEWQHVDAEIAAFVPHANKSPGEIASAARYLISSRVMDTATANRFANWLGSVVTPTGVDEHSRRRT